VFTRTSMRQTSVATPRRPITWLCPASRGIQAISNAIFIFSAFSRSIWRRAVATTPSSHLFTQIGGRLPRQIQPDVPVTNATIPALSGDRQQRKSFLLLPGFCRRSCEVFRCRIVASDVGGRSQRPDTTNRLVTAVCNEYQYANERFVWRSCPQRLCPDSRRASPGVDDHGSLIGDQLCSPRGTVTKGQSGSDNERQ